MTVGTTAFTTALAFIIGNYSADKEVCDLALGFEILVVLLWIILLKVTSHLLFILDVYLSSDIRSAEVKSKTDTEFQKKSRDIQNMSRNCILTVHLPFFSFGWVCFSIFSSRNVLEAQCFLSV